MATHVAWLARRFGRPELAPFTVSDVAALTTTLQRVGLRAGEKLLTAGEVADAAYVVEHGEIELFLPRHGSRHLVAIHRPGGVIGDIPLLCEMPAPYTAVARRDATVLVIEHGALLDLLGTHPAIALRWLTSTVRRLEHANRRIVALTIGDLRDRVLALLADELAGDERRHVDLTQAEMAALLGATRQSVNRVLHEFVGEGVIATGYGGVEVIDPRRLIALAGQEGVTGGRC
ncbi:MAG: Crp/Fnr family transcriptional regulator [Actinobacteria bacterium]|nr:Crp/Fnr family transcriptional regulator [Actinomycetota bacterium]